MSFGDVLHFSAWFGNGRFQAICDSDVGVVRIRFGPNREIRPYLGVGVWKGCAPSCSVSFVRFRNGGIPTIYDFEVGMVLIRSCPNREIRPYLGVGVWKGCAPSCSVSFVRFRNGGIPTIYDFEVGMVLIRSCPNREIRPYLGVGAGDARRLRIFCMMREEAMCDLWHRKTNRVDS